jgi:serine/threonine protein phosphatase 1
MLQIREETGGGTRLKRTLVISDIHGCYDSFIDLLHKLRFDAEQDSLILLGDYVDRGAKSKEVVQLVLDMVEKEGVIAIKGNHDQRLVDVIANDDEQARVKFFEHGGLQTLSSYCGSHFSEEDMEKNFSQVKTFIRENYSHHLSFLDRLPYYFEDNHHIYVHAGLNPHFTDWKQQSSYDFMYIKDDFIKNKTVVNKMVVFGHTKTINIHGTADIWFGGDKIGIDGGCVSGLQLNCLAITEKNMYNTYCVKND